MNYPFVIGTAQFGSHYGITNTIGQPTTNQINKILALALEKRVSYLDTALAYGQGLKYLCPFLNSSDSSLKVINKFSLKDNLDDVYKQLESYVAEHLSQGFYALLIHDPSNIRQINASDLNNFLWKLKEKGVIQKIGVSVYSPHELEIIKNLIQVEIVQCPINFFESKIFR